MGRTVSDLLRERARTHADRTFIWCGDERVTFEDFDVRTDRIAAGLLDLGVGCGDRIAVSASRMEVLEVFFACSKIGAVEVPMNIFLKGEFLRYQLDDCACETVLADGPGIDALSSLGLSDVKRVIALDAASAGTIPYGQLRATSPALPDFEPTARDLLAILYTSGTTGMPKGCMLSHGWYTHHAQYGREMLQYQADDVLFTALPLFHGAAQGMVIGALLSGLTAVIEPSFSATTILQRLAETGATTFAGVGMMALTMLGLEPSEADRAHKLRAALMMPLTPEQQRRFTDRFGAEVVAQYYGQTECGAVTISRIDEARPPGSMGKPSASFDVRLVDDDDVEVAVGEVGEIVVRPHVPEALFLGYWRNAEGTIETWRNLWHHTGDYGRADEDGYLYFVDRKQDSVRRRGENVSSVEIELAICKHLAVAEAAVHAVPAPLGEDDIKVCIVVSSPVEPAELFDFFKRTLPYFTIPRYVEVVPALPRNATQRVMKHLLRARGVTPETWDLEAMGFTVARDERR